MKLMDWNRLLSQRRLRRPPEKPIFPNSPFEEDQDRICYSQPFRRLQAKTQVHPLADNDHVRTRLIHSVEVGCIGQALGQLIAKELVERHKLQVTRQDFGCLLRAACLAHDIGHPPFGHAGDYAIRNWFDKCLPESLRKEISDAHLQDLREWEGNAQSFRILTQLENYRGNGGLQLTCATLATGMKYPWGVNSKQNTKSKFGYFQAEQNYATEIAEEVKLIPISSGGWCRHPLAYVVEAADDICYSIADLEDGIVMGSFDFATYEELLKPFLKIGDDYSIEYARVAESQAQKMLYSRVRTKAVWLKTPQMERS
jgi:dGTPase